MLLKKTAEFFSEKMRLYQSNFQQQRGDREFLHIISYNHPF